MAASAAVNKSARLSRFVNSVRVRFRGGNGGDGCISMLSLFANELAGPSGGNGGCGGHVVLRASRQVKSLAGVSTRYNGLDGERGRGKHQFGANAPHTIVDVPVGTIVTPAKPKELADHEFDPEQSDIVAELDQDGSMFVAARAGVGGRGNASYLSNINRHPRIAQRGGQGEERLYELWMKFYAHIGLIGLPNAGKSSLLRTMTHAKVRIGDYSFTTLHPQVGVLEYDDYTQIAISDLPGLIQDSHKNRGLGVQFLKSARRCLCLLYVIDLTCDPIEQMRILERELELYRAGLSRRPHMIVGNKIDHEESGRYLAAFKDYLAVEWPSSEFMTISTARGDGLEELRLEFRRMYDGYYSKHSDDPSDFLVW